MALRSFNGTVALRVKARLSDSEKKTGNALKQGVSGLLFYELRNNTEFFSLMQGLYVIEISRYLPECVGGKSY